LSAAILADRDVGVSVEALSCGEFDQRAGHGVRDKTEIALRKRIKTGHLETKVEADPQWHRSGCGEVVLKGGEQITECTLAAAEEPMRVPRLRRPGSVRCAGR
jgi:hypothetical protein